MIGNVAVRVSGSCLNDRHPIASGAAAAHLRAPSKQGSTGCMRLLGQHPELTARRAELEAIILGLEFALDYYKKQSPDQTSGTNLYSADGDVIKDLISWLRQPSSSTKGPFEDQDLLEKAATLARSEELGELELRCTSERAVMRATIIYQTQLRKARNLRRKNRMPLETLETIMVTVKQTKGERNRKLKDQNGGKKPEKTKEPESNRQRKRKLAEQMENVEEMCQEQIDRPESKRQSKRQRKLMKKMEREREREELEQERLKQERLEQERLEQERLEQERLDQERRRPDHMDDVSTESESTDDESTDDESTASESTEGEMTEVEPVTGKSTEGKPTGGLIESDSTEVDLTEDESSEDEPSEDEIPRKNLTEPKLKESPLPGQDEVAKKLKIQVQMARKRIAEEKRVKEQRAKEQLTQLAQKAAKPIGPLVLHINGDCRNTDDGQKIGAAAAILKSQGSNPFGSVRVLPNHSGLTTIRAKIEALVLGLELAIEFCRKESSLDRASQTLILSSSEYVAKYWKDWKARALTNSWDNFTIDLIANRDLIQRAANLGCSPELGAVTMRLVTNSDNVQADRLIDRILDQQQGITMRESNEILEDMTKSLSPHMQTAEAQRFERRQRRLQKQDQLLQLVLVGKEKIEGEQMEQEQRKQQIEQDRIRQQVEQDQLKQQIEQDQLKAQIEQDQIKQQMEQDQSKQQMEQAQEQQQMEQDQLAQEPFDEDLSDEESTDLEWIEEDLLERDLVFAGQTAEGPMAQRQLAEEQMEIEQMAKDRMAIDMIAWEYLAQEMAEMAKTTREAPSQEATLQKEMNQGTDVYSNATVVHLPDILQYIQTGEESILLRRTLRRMKVKDTVQRAEARLNHLREQVYGKKDEAGQSLHMSNTFSTYVEQGRYATSSEDVDHSHEMIWTYDPPL
ncbi:hypothetical protein BT63DRAFT_427816 [Microthyrium microscopicum]|uniref:RNase H type-1 domain-containing protein n=1 Tax=Microthyrium microscopicum TaxID=703497 RepID=A0A6A6U171_9PEZI|nr:hypothetical protein BT63DRAFT_427816 [Microthyrium microscopicum]